MNKVICIGECLIDMIPANERGSYIAKSGGAPANVAASVARLGGRGYYLGNLSCDGFGDIIRDSLGKTGVKLDYATLDDSHNTALAVVTLDKLGNRSFTFYRNDTADLMLDEADVKEDMFECGDVLHFCSVGLTESPSKRAHMKAVNLAAKKGAITSFDVNLRFGLYPDKEECKRTVYEFLPYCDVLKVTDEELCFLTDTADECEGVRLLFAAAQKARILFVTKGAEGAAAYDRMGGYAFCKAYDAQVKDTTGAGDCFIGGILYNIADTGLFESAESCKECLRFSSAACAVVVERKGAMEAMPTLEEVRARLTGCEQA